jgi:hypothetical protein
MTEGDEVMLEQEHFKDGVRLGISAKDLQNHE